MTRAARRWLVKSEPNAFSWQDLWTAPRRTTCWDGVRNFQARNFLRDDMQVGDPVFFYHSSADPTAIMGICEVVRAGYPDDTAFDKKSGHFDPKSDPEKPTWYMIDLRAVRPLAHPATLARLREERGLSKMVLLQRGSRLSVQPVTDEEWDIIERIGDKG
ncbi:MAG TPA: EVE domain-containing protein [Gemmatimonadaceae bacterium]|jgi:predicted RNA-binding protein with PUA-like domain|nr:EVE domain-containing protein [Gemmatimonadaceae bacterium]